MPNKTIRVLIAKPGLDGHDRGVKVVAQLLRDAGMEVIFIRYGICEEVARIALQEDVDVLGMGFYSSGYEHELGSWNSGFIISPAMWSKW